MHAVTPPVQDAAPSVEAAPVLVAEGAEGAGGSSGIDDDLQARLDNLKRG